MKKQSFLLPLILTAAILSGCGEKPTENNKARQPQHTSIGEVNRNNTVPQETEPAPEGENVVVFGQEDNSNIGIRIEVPDWKNDEKKVVNDKADNVIVEKKNERTSSLIENPDKKNAPKLVQDVPKCQAEKNISKDKKFIWQAKWHYTGVGGVWLNCIELSPDKSILAIVEKTGSDNGPYGSRIILINTYNWEIMRVHEYDKYLITKLCFVPNSNSMICWSEKQLSMKQPYTMLKVSCRTGRVIETNTYVKSPLSDMIVDGEGIHLFVKTDDSLKQKIDESSGKKKLSGFYMFNIKSFSQSPKKLMTNNKKGVFAISGNKSSIGLAGDKMLEVYGTDDFYPIYTVRMKEGIIPEKLTFTFNDKSLAILSEDNHLVSLKGKIFRDITNQVGNILYYDKTNREIVTEKKFNEELTFYNPLDLKQMRYFSPTALRPTTKGNSLLFEYLPHKKLYLLVDDEGNISLLQAGTRRWIKYLVLGPKK